MSVTPVFREWACPGNEYLRALELRKTILRKPLGLEFTEDELSKDLGDRHFGLVDPSSGEVIACLIVHQADQKKCKIRQVATARAFQHRGYGLLLAQEVERLLKNQGVTELFCHARESALPFYAKQGYQVEGDRFTEVGIPHFLMKKYI